MAGTVGDANRQRWSRLGVDLLPVEQGLDLLGRLAASALPQAMVIPVRWAQFAAARDGVGGLDLCFLLLTNSCRLLYFTSYFFSLYPSSIQKILNLFASKGSGSALLNGRKVII